VPTIAGKSPTIDSRDGEAILQQARALAPLYTPEWNALEDTGAAAALLKIVARMLEGIIRRLNDVPRKHFIAFLDSIGIKLLPALPARAPLTFFLSTGAKEAVAIPARSQVAAKPPAGGDPIIFETEKTILATPAKLQAIISGVPQKDKIIDHSTPLAAATGTELFSDDEKNLEEHVLYLADDDLFNVKGAATFDLSFTPPVNLAPPNVPGGPNAIWEYCAGEEEFIEAGVKQKRLAWRSFHVTSDSNKVTLEKDQEQEIKPVKVNNIKSRWIRCRIEGKLSPSDRLARLKLTDLKVAALTVGGNTGGVDPDVAFYNDFPLALPPSETKPLTPFGAKPKTNPDGSIAGIRPRQGDVFYLASQDAFSKRGSRISIRLGSLKPDVVSLDVVRVQGIGPTFAPLFHRAGINTVFQLIHLTPEQVGAIIGDTPGFARSRNVLEAAAKEFLDKVVSSGGEAPDPNRVTPELSWEYWNGDGWVGIKDLVDTTRALTIAADTSRAADPPLLGVTGIVTFTCPNDIALTKVIGQENYWIRARIAFGDYGQEKITFTSNPRTPADSRVVIDPSNIRPPEITSLKISYEVPGQHPQYCLTFNNLDYVTVLLPSEPSTSFAPFVVLDDAFQSLYLGFDQAPLKGPISIFFSLQEQEYSESNLPRIEWQYFRRLKGQKSGEWAKLLATDDTRNLTRSGTIEFIGPPDFAPAQRFAQSLFWIRAVDDANRFGTKADIATLPRRKALPPRSRPPSDRQVVSLPSLSLPGAESFRLSTGLAEVAVAETRSALAPCEQAIQSLTTLVKFPAQPSPTPPAPIVKGIYVNTAWAVQAETIQDEIAGSSDGSANLGFTLTKAPVIEESIWVDELATLTETERKDFSERKDVEVRIRKDADDNITEFLIRWSATEDLAEAQPADRVYIIDRTFGLLKFGDGKHGAVPPVGRDNIRATYSAGGGSAGNVETGLIKSLRSTIPLVDSAANPEPAGGGSDTEPIEAALERGPQVLKNRGRAIAAEDFEWLAKAASQAIARAKCLPTFNDQGQYETGWVTVLIVPFSNDARPLPSPLLRQRVEKYLLDRSANVASFPRHIKVIPPAYVAVRVQADIYPVSLDLAPQVESAAIQTLQNFLHPLTGGYQNSGWDFGRLPCLSDFYALLEAITGVDHVDNLSLELQATTLLGEFTGDAVLVSEDRPLDVAAPPFTLVYSGEHKITIQTPTTLLV